MTRLNTAYFITTQSMRLTASFQTGLAHRERRGGEGCVIVVGGIQRSFPKPSDNKHHQCSILFGFRLHLSLFVAHTPIVTPSQSISPSSVSSARLDSSRLMLPWIPQADGEQASWVQLTDRADLRHLISRPDRRPAAINTRGTARQQT